MCVKLTAAAAVTMKHRTIEFHPYKYFRGCNIHPSFAPQHCQNKGKKSIETEKSKLNSFFIQHSLPSSTTKSPLHTKLLVMVLSVLIGACVDLLHSLSSVASSQHWLYGFGNSHFTWALVVVLTSETRSSHL